MTGLVILAAIVAAVTHPAHGYDVTEGGKCHRINRPSAWAHVAWMLVCLAMIAGLVAWALMRGPTIGGAS